MKRPDLRDARRAFVRAVLVAAIDRYRDATAWYEGVEAEAHGDASLDPWSAIATELFVAAETNLVLALVAASPAAAGRVLHPSDMLCRHWPAFGVSHAGTLYLVAPDEDVQHRPIGAVCNDVPVMRLVTFSEAALPTLDAAVLALDDPAGDATTAVDSSGHAQ